MRARLHARFRSVLGGLAVAASFVASAGCHAPPGPEPPTSSSSRPRRAPNQDQDQNQAAPSHARARALLLALDGEAALAEFTLLLRADPRDALAGLGLAQTGLEFGLEAKAKAVLVEVLDADKIQGLGARLGLTLLAFHRYEAGGREDEFVAGELQLQNVLAVDPTNPHALAHAVLLYLQRAELRDDSQAPQARAICQGHDPAHAAVAASCAEEARRRGDPARARVLFGLATDSDPEHHGAWLRWGILELQAGNLRSARRYLEHATRSHWPSLRISAQATLGVALDRLGDTAAALTAYAHARDLCDRMHRPLPAELSFNLAIAASRTAEDADALAHATQMLEQLRDDPSTPASQRLQVQRALGELASIRAEQQRAQR